tara:strand:- start:3780 stop:5384 length:1605 start_codon:yes stop_codon:yes gene_type:complete
LSLVLGLHGGFTLGQHEPASCLIHNGNILGIYEEERFNRIKNSFGLLPKYSTLALLKDSNLSITDIDLVVVPGITYENNSLRWSLFLKHLFGYSPPIHVCHHQEAHIAAAFYGSGFNSSVGVSLDAYGDGLSGAIYSITSKHEFKKLKEFSMADSLGTIYTALTYHLGFEEGDEYKVMGLSSYGHDTENNVDFFSSSVSQAVTRSFPKILSPFDYPADSHTIESVSSVEQRPSVSELNQDHSNLAYSLQKSFQNRLLQIMQQALDLSSSSSLVYAGGVALNCSANKFLAERLSLSHFYVSPLASDRGLAFGCATVGAARLMDIPQPLGVPYYGSSYSNEDIINELNKNQIKYTILDDVYNDVSEFLNEGQIIGWFQGRSEAGARALGNRSILASASDISMRDKLNASIKYRELFRPFAPVVTLEDAHLYWKLQSNSDYACMTQIADALPLASEKIPAVVHTDGTSRIQVVTNNSNLPLYKLLKSFQKINGNPVLMNTSFNLKGQPIVESPRDALMTFYGCGINKLVLNNILVSK